MKVDYNSLNTWDAMRRHADDLQLVQAHELAKWAAEAQRLLRMAYGHLAPTYRPVQVQEIGFTEQKATDGGAPVPPAKPAGQVGTAVPPLAMPLFPLPKPVGTDTQLVTGKELREMWDRTGSGMVIGAICNAIESVDKRLYALGSGRKEGR